MLLLLLLSRNKNSLHFACMSGHAEVVKLLLDAGVSDGRMGMTRIWDILKVRGRGEFQLETQSKLRCRLHECENVYTLVCVHDVCSLRRSMRV